MYINAHLYFSPLAATDDGLKCWFCDNSKPGQSWCGDGKKLDEHKDDNSVIVRCLRNDGTDGKCATTVSRKKEI